MGLFFLVYFGGFVMVVIMWLGATWVGGFTGWFGLVYSSLVCGLWFGVVVWMCLTVLCFSLLLASVDGCFGFTDGLWPWLGWVFV